MTAHSYTESKKDDDNHWTECECGQQSGVTAHSYTESKKDDDNHWTECECGQQSGVTAHSYTESKKDDDNHWTECECGQQSGVTAHTFEWVTDKQPTESETGLKHEECECGQKRSENTEIPMLEHTHDYGELITGSESTCTTAGTVNHYQCAGCKLYFDENKSSIQSTAAPLKEHSFGELKSAVPSTCTAEGTLAHKQCSECEQYFDADGNILDSILDPIDEHSFGEWQEAVPSTCTAAGTLAHKQCSECGQYFDADENILDSILDPIDEHSFGEWQEAVPSTCTAEGTLAHKQCSECEQYFDADGNILDSILDPVDEHSFGEWQEAVPSTCTAEGAVAHKQCSECEQYFDAAGNKLDSILDPADGHAWVSNGVGYDCGNCGATAYATWQLVTDASQLKAGDKIVIVAKDVACALSTTQNSNNRGVASVTKNENEVTIGSETQIITLQDGKNVGTYAFYVETGYLYAASSSSNYLRTETSLSLNSSWSISIDTSGVATITAQGEYTRNLLKYNKTSSLFACYASGQNDVCIYILNYAVCNHSENANADDNNCSTELTCSMCGAIVVKAESHSYEHVCDTTCDNDGCTYERTVTHTPMEDDGDCTTAVRCGVCGVVITEAKTYHTPAEDDGDCSTAIECTVCYTVTTAADQHDFSGVYESDGDGHWRVCQNDGCSVKEDRSSHVSSGEATATEAEVCTLCAYVITPAQNCEHTDTSVRYNDDQHWTECDGCGYAFDYVDHVANEDDNNCTTALTCRSCAYVYVASQEHTPADDDNDCTTALTCQSCAYVYVASQEHTPVDDDADCTTAVKCSVCGTVITAANAEHTYGDDKTCQNEGCNQEQPLEEKKYSYTFTEKIFSANSSSQKLGDVDWTLDGSGGSYWGYDSTKGQQFGSSSVPYTTMTLTSGEFTNVTKIVINTSGASSIAGTLTVTVGGKQIGDAITLTKTNTAYTFECDEALTGEIVLQYTQTSKKAIYIKSIEVTYAE